MHPVRFAPSSDGTSNLTEDLDAKTRAALFDAMLSATMDLLERHEPSEWPRNNPPGDGEVEPENYVPQVVEGSFSAAHHQARYADCWYSMIPHFRSAGVSESTLDRVIDWGALMWPDGDWDALR